MDLSGRPAQQQLVSSLLDWGLVQKRLARYPAIAESFPTERLKKRELKAPYFCHYMAWPLGTWQSEELFQRLDQLLEYAQSLPNWARERGILSDGEFGAFYALVWQLQVAELLGQIGSNVQWNGSGPDLQVTVDGRRLFVECYTYRKSFSDEIYLEEVLSKLGRGFRVDRQLFRPFSLSSDKSAEFSRLLSPLLNNCERARLLREAESCYPLVVSTSTDRKVTVYVEGESPEAYTPGVLPQAHGCPDSYLDVALKEGLSAKAKSNDLAGHRPNLVLVNYALSRDVQVAPSLSRTALSLTLEADLGDGLDAVVFSTAGIDAVLTPSALQLAYLGSADHPLVAFIHGLNSKPT